jgi:hypothetical protein
LIHDEKINTVDKNALKYDQERSDNIPFTYLTLPLFIEAPVQNPESERHTSIDFGNVRTVVFFVFRFIIIKKQETLRVYCLAPTNFSYF